MDRRNFLVSLAAIAATPALLYAGKPKINPAWFSAPMELSGERRTLIDWLEDLHREKLRVVQVCGGSEAVEFFRQHYGCSTEFPPRDWHVFESCIRTRFTPDHLDWRYRAMGNVIIPTIKIQTREGILTKLNPEWKNAPIGLMFAAEGATIHYAYYDRKTFQLVG